MPSWATGSSWACLGLALALRPGRGGLDWLALLIGLFLYSMGSAVALISSLFLCATALATALKLRGQELSLQTIMARLLVLPALAYLAVYFGLWLRGVPPVISQSCVVCSSNLKNLATAIEGYASQHHGEIPSQLSQIVPAYLSHAPQCLGGDALSPQTRVFFRHRGLELADGYGFRRVGKDGYVIWCRSRGYSGHQGSQHRWYDSSSGLHSELDGWKLVEGPTLQAQLDQGPPDDLLQAIFEEAKKHP